MDMNVRNVSIYLDEEYEELAKTRVEEFCRRVPGRSDFSVEDYLRGLLVDALVRDKVFYNECKEAGLV